MRSVLKAIDYASELAGRIDFCLVVVLVAVMIYEVISRYVFNSPTMWAYETAMMLGGTISVLAWSYVQRHRRHIRIEFLYGRLKPRGRAVIDVLGGLLLFFPLIIFFIYASIAWATHAWIIGERMPETFWYPPAAPLRTVVVIGFCLFALQGAAQFFRDFYMLLSNKSYD